MRRAILIIAAGLGIVGGLTLIADSRSQEQATIQPYEQHCGASGWLQVRDGTVVAEGSTPPTCSP